MSLLRTVVVSESQDRALALWAGLPSVHRAGEVGEPRVVHPTRFLALNLTDVRAVFVDPETWAQHNEAAFREKAAALVAVSVPVELVQLA